MGFDRRCRDLQHRCYYADGGSELRSTSCWEDYRWCWCGNTSNGEGDSLFFCYFTEPIL